MTKKNTKVQEQVTVEDELTETAIVAVEELPGLVPEADYSYGSEHAAAEHKITSEELIIPMLRIVQDSSKILSKEGSTAEVGDIYNTVTGQIWSGKTGLLVVPICANACVIERKDQKSGGDFIAKLSADLKGPKADPRVVEAYNENAARGESNPWVELKSAQRTQLIYTIEVYVALIERKDGVTATSVALIPFSGKNVFPRKLWWSGMAEAPKDKNGHGSPRYSFRTVLKTKIVPNKAGKESAIFVPEPYGGSWGRCRLAESVPSHKETLDRCLGFLNLVESGALGRADYSTVEESEDAQEAAALEDQPAF